MNETFAVLAIIYLLPCGIAILRDHPYRGAILIVNLFLGWTFLGWVIALAWAVFPIERSDHRTKSVRANGGPIELTNEYIITRLDECPPELQPELRERLAAHVRRN